jgi:hypothetical protein
MRYELWVITHRGVKKLVASFVSEDLGIRLMSDLQYDSVYKDYYLIDTIGGK